MSNERSVVVTVRLSRPELDALRTVPAETDAARLRSLIHARALAEAVNGTVVAEGEKTRRMIAEFARRLQAVLGREEA